MTILGPVFEALFGFDFWVIFLKSSAESAKGTVRKMTKIGPFLTPCSGNTVLKTGSKRALYTKRTFGPGFWGHFGQ